MITGDQLRMARALLRLTMRELARLCDIDQGTVVRVEAGAGAHKLTLQRLRQVLEERGVRFIPSREGDHEPGVALKWGVAATARAVEDAAPAKEGEPGMKAAPWDDFAEAVPAEIESLRAYWRGHPAEWAALADVSRFALLSEMRLESLGEQAR